MNSTLVMEVATCICLPPHTPSQLERSGLTLDYPGEYEFSSVSTGMVLVAIEFDAWSFHYSSILLHLFI